MGTAILMVIAGVLNVVTAIINWKTAKKNAEKK